LSDRTNLIVDESNKSSIDKIKDNWNKRWSELNHRYTYITDENGNDKKVGFIGKAKYKLKQIKTDLTTCTEIDENGNQKEVKYSVITGLKRNITQWYTNLTTPEIIENEPIRPINNKAPEYREWKDEDGSRVSPVQKRKIPDMNKAIIERPLQSKKKNDAVRTEQASSVKVEKPKVKKAIKTDFKKFKETLKKLVTVKKHKTKSTANTKNKKAKSIMPTRNRGNSR
jgi:hypothetical protein